MRHVGKTSDGVLGGVVGRILLWRTGAGQTGDVGTE